MAMRAPSAPIKAAKQAVQEMGRGGGKCRYCGINVERYTIEAERHRLATVEHLIPKSRGGTNNQSNLGLSCQACNNIKGDMTDVEFKHLINERKLHPQYMRYITSVVLNNIDRRIKRRR